MINIKKNAFTLTEMIIVIAIIGILMAGTTIYLQGSDETRKIIEAQGCASTIGGNINTYIFYALTSKSLRLSSTSSISPDIYNIALTGCNDQSLCNSFEFSYTEKSNSTGKNTFETHSISDTCHIREGNLEMSRTGHDNNSYIKINKGFAPQGINENDVFIITGSNHSNLTGEIILYLCLEDNCSKKKEVSKRVVDGRTQTIALKNCVFYEEEDKDKCREREN